MTTSTATTGTLETASAPGRTPHRARAGAGMAALSVLIALVTTAALATSADARPALSRTAPAAVSVSQRPATGACPGTADAAQHWSELARRPACERGLSVEPSSETTWVCPVTPDAAEHWVRAIGVAGCRR